LQGSGTLDKGHRHYGSRGATTSTTPTYKITSLLNPTDPSQLYDDTLPEYLGPVAIDSIRGRGRGVFTTKDISSGELLIASKALAIVFPDSSLNCSKLWREVKKLGALREQVGDLIKQEPGIASQIYDLYAGPHLGYFETPAEIAAKTIELIDMERIERICSFNAFQGSVQGYKSETCFGLWYFPSFINHDCLGANARWTVFKNFMFVRAFKPIAKGEEVLISYVDPNESSAFRRNFFLKHEFQCSCALCCLERSDGQCVRRRRDILLEDFRESQAAEDGGNFEIIQTTLTELESLRPGLPESNVFLIQPLICAGFSHYEKSRYEDAQSYFTRVFDLCSQLGQLSLLCVSCSFTIATCLLRRGKNAEASHWVEISKAWMKKTYGTTENGLIQILRPSFFNEMNANGLM